MQIVIHSESVDTDSVSTNSIFWELRNLPTLAGLAERGSLPPLAYRAFRQDCHKTPLTANCLKYTPSAQRQQEAKNLPYS
jgi:hypothetical protein